MTSTKGVKHIGSVVVKRYKRKQGVYFKGFLNKPMTREAMGTLAAQFTNALRDK